MHGLACLLKMTAVQPVPILGRGGVVRWVGCIYYELCMYIFSSFDPDQTQ
jgi:hypothetical protein